MHIMTALVMAAMFGKSDQRDSLAPLKALVTGPIQVAHALPGRIRFLIPSLRGTGAGDPPAVARLQAIHGIETVDFTAISGSLVVTYRPDQVDAQLLPGALARLLGLEEEFERTPSSVVTQELQLVAQSLNRAVLDKSHGLVDLWSATALVLIAVGGRKVMADGWRALPAGFTLIWWGLHSLRASGNTPQ